MPDPVRSPSSIPHGALMDAMCEAVDQGHPVTTNGMLAILRAAEPKLYAYWAEGRVEAVARALFAHRTKGEYGSWEVAPHDAKVEDFAHARRLLGLGERT